MRHLLSPPPGNAATLLFSLTLLSAVVTTTRAYDTHPGYQVTDDLQDYATNDLQDNNTDYVTGNVPDTDYALYDLPVRSALSVTSKPTGACTYNVCSYDDAAIVIEQWNRFALDPSGDHNAYLLIAGRELFKMMFVLKPSTKTILAHMEPDNIHVDNVMFSNHILRVMNGIDMMINQLHNRQVLTQLIKHMTHHHMVYGGITKEMFDTMKMTLYIVLPDLIDYYNEDPWHICLTPIFDGIANAMSSVDTGSSEDYDYDY